MHHVNGNDTSASTLSIKNVLLFEILKIGKYTSLIIENKYLYITLHHK